jgi:hypothetical protein
MGSELAACRRGTQVLAPCTLALLTGPDHEKVRWVTATPMQMKEIDVKTLQQARPDDR